MDDAKIKHEMSVELARRRELAYKQKLARLGLLSENSSQDPNQPFQGSSSSYQARASNPTSKPMPTRPQNLTPRPFQIRTSSPTLNPSPNLSGTKRKEAITNHQKPQPQKPRSSPSQPEYRTTTAEGYSYCTICEVPCSSRLNLQQHLAGKPHKNKLQLLEWNKRGVSRPFCETCHIYCMDDGALKMHYNGQKHKSKLQNVEFGGEKKYHRACDLCKIWCMDEDTYQQHLRGKKHIARAYAAENR